MKINDCCRRRHRLWTLSYTPRFCRSCGAEQIETRSFTKGIITGAVTVATIMQGYFRTDTLKRTFLLVA